MQEQKILLSIVIPHYNVSSYIDCLYHILFPQLTKETEVILIDDCSTDDTREKMQKWEQEQTNPYIRFHYLQTNLGLSEARNRGIQLASGEYVWFIDSDDTITENAVEKLLYTLRKTKADAIVFDFFRFYGDGTICNNEIKDSLKKDSTNPLQVTRSKYRSLKHNLLTSDKEIQLSALFDDAQMYVCFYVLKKQYWIQNPFPAGRSYEDIAVMPKIIYTLNTLYYIPEPLYYYRQRNESIVNAPTIESCFDMIKNIQNIHIYFRNFPLTENVQISLYTFYIRMLRLSYEKLYKHRLLSEKTYQQYTIYEQIFLKELPWNKYLFILKMRIYPVFKLTSFLFFVNKHIYVFVKKLVGRD